VTVGPEPTETLHPAITPVVFWEPFALDRPQGLLLGEMIREFEAENPTILLEIVPKSGYVGIHGAILDQLPDGELPDLAVAFPSMIAEYLQADVVVPLDLYLNDPEIGLSEEDLADIPPNFLEAGRFPGTGRQVLAFPFSLNAIGMWVNEGLLNQAGWDRPPATWAEFEQACFDVLAYTGVGCYPIVESVSTFSAWLYSRGGQLLDPSGQRALFNSPAGVESLAQLHRLMDAGLAWRPEDPYGDYVAFANGQAAFTFGSTGNGRLYADAYTAAVRNGVEPFPWRQIVIPQSDPAKPLTALYGATFFILRSDTARQEAAWRFVRWFSEPQQSARWAGELEALPVRMSALAVMTDTLEAFPFVQAQVEGIAPFGKPEPAVPGALEARSILYTALVSVTQNYADPQVALDLAARDVDVTLSSR
jgi:multiple sugar transport system substrate-binding protein/sn-glycerol 3-phosphate transport system substrate-binding protein